MLLRNVVSFSLSLSDCAIVFASVVLKLARAVSMTAGESTPTPAYVVFEKLSFSVGDAWPFFFHGDILAALGALLPASPHQIGTCRR